MRGGPGGVFPPWRNRVLQKQKTEVFGSETPSIHNFEVFQIFLSISVEMKTRRPPPHQPRPAPPSRFLMERRLCPGGSQRVSRGPRGGRLGGTEGDPDGAQDRSIRGDPEGVIQRGAREVTRGAPLGAQRKSMGVARGGPWGWCPERPRGAQRGARWGGGQRGNAGRGRPEGVHGGIHRRGFLV